jgi:dTDP-glucose pyrophosphorylase/predicted transcriptional regulator
MTILKNILIHSSATIKEAIDVLNKEKMRIVIVVDNNNKIEGTVTDGDIRRGLVKYISINDTVKCIMHRSPTVANFNDDKDEVLERIRSKNLLSIPIVDNNNVVVGIETLQHLTEKQYYDNPVVIMAGGRGERLQPLTNDYPKPLLHVGKQPILETIIKQFIDYGFHKFYISINYKSEMIKEYFGDGRDFGASIEYINEKKPLGTAGSLGNLPDNLPNLPVVMMNGDLLTKVNFVRLLQFHNEQECVATMCVREYDFQVPYGVVEHDKHILQKIVEKPVNSFFVNAGIYVLNPEILMSIPSNTKLDMTTFLQDQVDFNNNVSIFPLHEYWLDIGRVEEYERAQKDIKLFK